MFELLGISSQALFGQLLIGLINGSFYALLSLGLAVIFGMLNIINFTHGAQYMLGAFAAYFLLLYAGLGYWWAIIIAPILVGITGIIIERLFLQWLYKLDHLYGLLLTFGLALIFEGTFRNFFGSSGLPYSVPPTLQGGQNLGFMFLPNYRAWVVVVPLGVCSWLVVAAMRVTMCATVQGSGVGLLVCLTKVLLPEASKKMIIIIMANWLLIRSAGVFGRAT